MREGADIGFLHHILGVGVVAQDAAGQPIKPAVIRLHDHANRGFVAGKRAPHQLGVNIAGRRWLRCSGLAHDDLTNNRVLGLDAPGPKRFPEILLGPAGSVHLELVIDLMAAKPQALNCKPALVRSELIGQANSALDDISKYT